MDRKVNVFVGKGEEMDMKNISVVGRVTAFNASGPGSIPGRVKDFNPYLGSGTGSTQPREDN